MTVSEALRIAAGARATVTGFVLLAEGQAPVLCEELLESMPPQCGGARLELAGFDPTRVSGLREGEGARWSAGAVSLSGIVRDGRLHLDR